MNVAIYLRKSRSEEGAEISDTLKIHKSILLETAKKMGLNIIKIYEEVVSGDSLFSRPQMLLLLKAVESYQYDAVLCMDIDRLGRGGMRDQGIILDTFKYSSTKIITPDKTYDLNNDDDEELTEFKSFISRRELKIIKKRLTRGLNQTIKSGGYVANPPYGYSSYTINKTPSLKINEEEAKFVRLIFDMYINKGMGCQLIANFLNSAGAKPRRSNSFGRTSVASIIKNPVYIGAIVRNKSKQTKKAISGENKIVRHCVPKDNWEYFEGLHEPIISKSVFLSAQKIMNSRSHSPNKNKELQNPLAGIVICSRCGLYMQRTVAQGKYIYLSCPQKGCSKSEKLSFVEEKIIFALDELLNAIKIEYYQSPAPNCQGKRLEAILQNEKGKCLNQLNNICELLEQGIYDSKTYKSRKEIIEVNIGKINEQIHFLQHEDKTGQKNKGNKIAPKNLSQLLNICSTKEKNIILKCLIKKATYSKDTKGDNFSINISLKDI